MSTQTFTLDAASRQNKGTRDSRRLRRDGHVPAVIYGHGEQNANVALPQKATVEALRRGAHVIELKLDGGATEQVLVKDVQYNHLGDTILHLDLFRVNLDEEVHSDVRLHLIGEAKGALEGGILTQMRDTLEVICKVRDIPDEIRIDVSGLGVGDAVHVSEIELPAGSKLPPHDADFTIAMVAAKKIRAEDEEVAPEDGAEPEVIGDKQTAVQPGENAEEIADQNA